MHHVCLSKKITKHTKKTKKFEEIEQPSEPVMYARDAGIIRPGKLRALMEKADNMQ